jgi:hypothetical protein
MKQQEEKSFGVFKPTGHLVISFPTAAQAAAAAGSLSSLGVVPGDVQAYTDREMLAQIDHDMQHASPLAAVGQELNLIKAHRALAERGYHWLVVRVDDDEHARRLADSARRDGAERAQRYGRFIIEELIPAPTRQAQVAESPDRGLDAQTHSGQEAERATRREVSGNSVR